jgi:hypothetical protein
MKWTSQRRKGLDLGEEVLVRLYSPGRRRKKKAMMSMSAVARDAGVLMERQ